MPEIKYEVVDKIGIVSEGNNGWNKELNLISWNEREPVYDIRTWSPDHEKMGKGVTISVAEAKVLRDMLNALNLYYSAKINRGIDPRFIFLLKNLRFDNYDLHYL